MGRRCVAESEAFTKTQISGSSDSNKECRELLWEKHELGMQMLCLNNTTNLLHIVRQEQRRLLLIVSEGERERHIQTVSACVSALPY